MLEQLVQKRSLHYLGPFPTRLDKAILNGHMLPECRKHDHNR